MTSPSDPSPAGGGPLQFDRAEFSRSDPKRCQACGVPIVDTYYEANGKMVCPECRARLLASSGRGMDAPRLGQAFLFGLGAAILGAAIYFAVAWLSGYEFSIIAVLVGYLVGTAVRRGSGGFGGPIYQALALVLTYAAIAATNLPLDARVLTNPLIWWRAAIAPFQEGTRNILGLVIIAIGLYEAWRLTAAPTLSVSGPYQIGAAPPPP